MTSSDLPGSGPVEVSSVPQTTLRRSAAISAKVIWALMMREIITRYGRHNIGFLWLFVEPMLFSVGITALWSITGMNHGSTLPITAFALTGYSSILAWRNMPNRLQMAIKSNTALFYHRNVRPMDVYLARATLEAVAVTSSFFFLAVFFMIIGWMDPPEDMVALAGAWLLTLAFGFALGLAIGTLTERGEVAEKLWHPAAYLIFPVSGAVSMVDALPEQFRSYVLLLPMPHTVEMIREAWFGSKVVAHYDVMYLIYWIIGLTLFSLALERRISRELVIE